MQAGAAGSPTTGLLAPRDALSVLAQSCLEAATEISVAEPPFLAALVRDRMGPDFLSRVHRLRREIDLVVEACSKERSRS